MTTQPQALRYSAAEILRAFAPSRQADPALPRETPSARGAIAEGQRNARLTSIAGTLRRQGVEGEALVDALHAVNRKECNPPLDAEEVEQIAQSISRYPSANPSIFETLHDTGNAVRFVAQHGSDVRYVTDRGQWLLWRGQRWEPDTMGEIIERAKQTATSIYAEANPIEDKDARKATLGHAKASHSEPRLKAMVKLAQTNPTVVLRSAQLDADPLLVGVRNGVVDVTTGTLLDARREQLITMRMDVDYDPNAKCERFEAFVAEIMADDPELVEFTQRTMGYALTGLTTEQCLFFLYGKGANGKSTLLNTLKSLWGDYAKQASADALVAKKQPGGASNDIARLASARLVISNEIEDGSQLTESLVKQMSGDGDTVTSRFLYKEFFEFAPRFKIFIAGNHRPIIKGTDDGIWRRIRLIPFTVSFKEADADPQLLRQLAQERPGILNWVLAGYRKYAKHGLPMPPVVRDAVVEYREDMDMLGQWLNDSPYEVAPELQSSALGLYTSYSEWAKSNGFKFIMTSVTFARALKDRGFEKGRNANGRVYKGIGVRIAGGPVARPALPGGASVGM